jgi:hypothetical protein
MPSGCAGLMASMLGLERYIYVYIFTNGCKAIFTVYGSHYPTFQWNNQVVEWSTVQSGLLCKVVELLFAMSALCLPAAITHVQTYLQAVEHCTY